MKTITRCLLLLWSVVICAGCEDKLNLKVDDLAPRLVVEGSVSDGEPAEVRLSWTASYGYDAYTPKISGAAVCLVDDQSNCIDLRQVAEGVYSSIGSDFRGEPGRHYSIELILPDGRNYKSAPELLRPPLEVDSVYFEYIEQEEYNSRGLRERVPYIQLFADIPNPQDQDDYLLWKWSGIFEYSPPLRSNESCWVTEEESYRRFNVFSDKEIDKNQLIKRKIDLIKVDYRFRVHYAAVLRQYSLGKEAHQFLEGLKHQLERSGGFSDPPPYRVKGNIRNVADEKEVVLGYFYAAGLYSKHVSVLRVDIPRKFLRGPDCGGPFFGPPPEICVSCNGLPGSSDVPPSFWYE